MPSSTSDPSENNAPLISEETPDSLARTFKKKFSRIGTHFQSKESENSPPLISEVPPEDLEAKWPSWFDDDLVTELDDLLKDEDFVDYLLNSNTFFHGKIGFYSTIIKKIGGVRNFSPGEDVYIRTIENLTTADASKKPLIVMPITESQDAFNNLVAKSFTKTIPLWLIAHPLTTHPHLLIAFHNFFIAGSTNAELEHLQHIFKLSDSTMRMLESGAYKGIIITDYKPFVDKTNTQTATVLRLRKL